MPGWELRRQPPSWPRGRTIGSRSRVSTRGRRSRENPDIINWTWDDVSTHMNHERIRKAHVKESRHRHGPCRCDRLCHCRSPSAGPRRGRWSRCAGCWREARRRSRCAGCRRDPWCGCGSSWRRCGARCRRWCSRRTGGSRRSRRARSWRGGGRSGDGGETRHSSRPWCWCAGRGCSSRRRIRRPWCRCPSWRGSRCAGRWHEERPREALGMACRSSGAPHASHRRLGDTPWPRVPQKFTSMPRARAAAAFVSAARSAPAASFA
jgi:hypothetical protein